MEKQLTVNNIKQSFKRFSFYDFLLSIALILTTLNYKIFSITYSYRKPDTFMQLLFFITIFYPIFYFLKQKSKFNLLFFMISSFVFLILLDLFKRFFYIPRPDKLERILANLLKTKPFKSNHEFQSALKKYISNSHDSFPSAHAASCTFSVFCFFEILQISFPLNEIGKKTKLFGKLIVLCVCIERIVSNKHRFEDVFCGVGVGYLYSKCVLVVYDLFIGRLRSVKLSS